MRRSSHGQRRQPPSAKHPAVWFADSMQAQAPAAAEYRASSGRMDRFGAAFTWRPHAGQCCGYVDFFGVFFFVRTTRGSCALGVWCACACSSCMLCTSSGRALTVMLDRYQLTWQRLMVLLNGNDKVMDADRCACNRDGNLCISGQFALCTAPAAVCVEAPLSHCAVTLLCSTMCPSHAACFVLLASFRVDSTINGLCRVLCHKLQTLQSVLLHNGLEHLCSMAATTHILWQAQRRAGTICGHQSS